MLMVTIACVFLFGATCFGSTLNVSYNGVCPPEAVSGGNWRFRDIDAGFLDAHGSADSSVFPALLSAGSVGVLEGNELSYLGHPGDPWDFQLDIVLTESNAGELWFGFHTEEATGQLSLPSSFIGVYANTTHYILGLGTISPVLYTGTLSQVLINGHSTSLVSFKEGGSTLTLPVTLLSSYVRFFVRGLTTGNLSTSVSNTAYVSNMQDCVQGRYYDPDLEVCNK